MVFLSEEIGSHTVEIHLWKSTSRGDRPLNMQIITHCDNLLASSKDSWTTSTKGGRASRTMKAPMGGLSQLNSRIFWLLRHESEKERGAMRSFPNPFASTLIASQYSKEGSKIDFPLASFASHLCYPTALANPGSFNLKRLHEWTIKAKRLWSVETSPTDLTIQENS